MDAIPTREGQPQPSEFGPKIFFNKRCFTGPLLSKGRLAEAPESYGPGRVVKTLKDVITTLVNVAYKSKYALKCLQKTDTRKPNTHIQCIKTRLVD